MPVNTPYADLKESIKKLEKEKVVKEQAFKEEFKTTIENLNPFNLIRKSFASFAESSEVRNNLIGLAIPLVAGIFTKKSTAGKRSGSFLQQAGILFFDGLNRYITQNPEIVQSIGQYFVRFFKKKEPENNEEE